MAKALYVRGDDDLAVIISANLLTLAGPTAALGAILVFKAIAIGRCGCHRPARRVRAASRRK